MLRGAEKRTSERGSHAELGRLLGEAYRSTAHQDKGYDFESADHLHAIELKLSLLGSRDFGAAVLRLATIIADSPSLRRATLIAKMDRMSGTRVLEEWRRIRSVLSAKIARRLALVALAADRTVTVPEDDAELNRLTALAERALASRKARHEVDRAISTWTPRSFDAWMVLLDAWLRGEPPLEIQEIVRRSGCSYPTVAAMLDRLSARGELMRTRDRRATFASIPRRSLDEILVVSDALRSTLRFIDSSGRRVDPEELLRRFNNKAPKDVAVGGVIAARHYAPDFDLHGIPRIDLSIPGPRPTPWLASVDPALERATTQPSPILVIHFVRRRDAGSDRMRDRRLPLASPAETLLDIYDLRLTSQAEDFIRTMRYRKAAHG